MIMRAHFSSQHRFLLIPLMVAFLSSGAAMAQAKSPASSNGAKTPVKAPPPAAMKPSTSTTAPSAAAPTAPAKKIEHAVLPLVAVGVDETTRQQLQSDLRSALASRGLNLQVEGTTNAHMKASRLSCLETDTGCLVKLGFVASVQKIVAGRVEPAAGGTRITLFIVDVEGARQEKRVEDLVAVEPLARAKDLARITGELLGDGPEGGDILVRCDKPNAIVLIDGVKIGITPLAAPVRGLVRGRHNIEVRLPGHRSYQGTADVENGKVVEVTVIMISMVTEEEVVLSEGPLQTTEVHEGPAATRPDEVGMLPLVLLTAGVGGLIVGAVGLVVGTGALGYSAFLDQAIRVGVSGDPILQENISYVGIGALVVGAVLIVGGAAVTTTSFFVE